MPNDYGKSICSSPRRASNAVVETDVRLPPLIGKVRRASTARQQTPVNDAKWGFPNVTALSLVKAGLSACGMTTPLLGCVKLILMLGARCLSVEGAARGERFLFPVLRSPVLNYRALQWGSGSFGSDRHRKEESFTTWAVHAFEMLDLMATNRPRLMLTAYRRVICFSLPAAAQ
jgi:hypothetical protein